MEHTQWYKDRVFYQIWPRSFKDGDGDGMGDLWGVYEKLDYIKSLGVGGIWFSPLYPSPGVDCGYDISDYMDIAPEYGGMEAFEKVLEGAHARDIKVIMDLVVNHTSSQHEWFQKSRRRIEPYTDYYIWRPARPDGGLPNNWDSLFEGKAWQYDELRGEYYLHLFAVEQPDLNMDNPLVREEVKKILRFWLDKGVDGFREDVITFISKAEGLPDDRLMPASRGLLQYNNGPHLLEYLTEFYNGALADYDCMTLAEGPMVNVKKALEYIEEKPGKVIDMIIQFECMSADCIASDYIHTPFSLRRLKQAWTKWQKGLDGKAWNMLYLENHDHPRVISRYGSEKYRVLSGKTLAAAYLFQKGTPFVYQGQEIGMTNWYPSDPEMYEDVQTRWQYFNKATKRSPEKRLKRLWAASRDSARTPVQWTDGPKAGFTEGEPWFYLNDNYREVNVAAAEADPDSLLHFYRRAIALRQSLPVVRSGSYREFDATSGRRYVYAREGAGQRLLVACAFSEAEQRFRAPAGFDLSAAKLVLQNYPDAPEGRLRPYECRVYLWD